MLLNVYDVLYSLYSHQHVSPTTAAIFRVILLQENKGTNVVTFVTVKPACFRLSKFDFNFMWTIYLPTHPPTNLPNYLPTSVVVSMKNLMVAHRMQKFAKFHTISHNWTPFYAIIQSTPLRLIYFRPILVWCSHLHRPVHTTNSQY